MAMTFFGRFVNVSKKMTLPQKVLVARQNFGRVLVARENLVGSLLLGKTLSDLPKPLSDLPKPH